jgi:RNA polymerase sigma-70 factor (ECF subfamily)
MDTDPHPVRWTDPEAVAACVEAHRPRLLAFVAHRMGPALRQRLDPDDIVQEVSLAAVRPAHAPAPAEAPQREPFAWLCHVAEQRIIDAHRRYFATAKRNAGREVSIDARRETGDGEGGFESLLAVSMTTPSQAMSRDAKEFRLALAIESLPADQRKVMRMRYVDGLATKEIAERLGKSDVAVRVMLSRTVQKLQQLLGD